MWFFWDHRKLLSSQLCFQVMSLVLTVFVFVSSVQFGINAVAVDFFIGPNTFCGISIVQCEIYVS
jgi:hypothetical protein